VKLELKQFGGIIPGTDPVNLPQNAAQTAENVDLSEGTLKPWSQYVTPRTYNHTGGEISATEFAQGSKPTPAPVATLYDLIGSNPENIFGDITAKVWKYARGTAGTDGTSSGVMVSKTVSYTPTGFVLHCEFPETEDPPGTFVPDIRFTILKGQPYELVGPLYQIDIASVDATGNQSYTFPTTLSSGATVIPAFSIPLYTTLGGTISAFQVGTLQCVDISTPSVTGQRTDPGTTGTTTILFSGTVDFHFECNWIRNRPQLFYYLSMAKDANDHYGPESDVSEGVLIPPGKYASIAYQGDRLYRSASTASGFGLVKEGSSPFIEDLTKPVLDDLPPNGTVTGLAATGSPATVDGSIKHPAGYAVYYKDATLYPSSEWVEFPRYWAVPAEYAYTFDSNITCIALAGATILVFTGDGVYAATGQHPGRLTVIKISDKPIGARTNLWKDDLIVGWLNEEGLVQYDGASGRLLTGEYMRADLWNSFLNTDEAVCKVTDKTVLIQSPDTNFRFDFRGDRTAAISTYTVDDGSADFIWKSKRFVMPKPMSWYACRINTTIPAAVVNLKLYADGVQVVNEDVSTNEDILLPRTVKAWEWEVYVEGEDEIRSIALATNRREL
jgi:hypothetical protein